MSTQTIARLAAGVIVGAMFAMIFIITAHADPDICGTGKFYNSYDNSCVPTDRGAYPNYGGPGSSGGPGVPYPGYGGHY
jgi:hypothetical protein